MRQRPSWIASAVIIGAAGLVLAAGPAAADVLVDDPFRGAGLVHPGALVPQAKDIRIERRQWDDAQSADRTVASARATAAWLGRLMNAGLRDSGRWPESRCAVACRRCPDQLALTVTFKTGPMSYHLSLFMREGLAFLRSDSSVAWSFADSLEPVLALIREGLPKDDVVRDWTAPTAPPVPLDPDSAAFRDDDICVTGMPEQLVRVGPSYPAEARRLGISGVVHVQTLVRADGTIARVFASKSIPELDEAAFAAVRAWKFKPATCGGRPVAVWVTNPVRFTLR